MTASLNDSYTGSSYFGSDSLAPATNKVRKKNKKIKKGEAIMLVKKQLAPSKSSAYKSSTWSNYQPPAPKSKKIKASMVIPKSKNAIKKKMKVSKPSKPPDTELLLKQAKQVAGDTKNLHLLQEAIVEFRTQRDQFVQSLNGLQRKLKEFQIPELFSPSGSSKTDKDEKDQRNSSEKLKKQIKKEKNDPTDKGDRKVKKKKDVRSVSQHFYLADMTESEGSSSTLSSSSSSSSSSSDSSSSQDEAEVDEKKLADKKVKDFLDFNLIPIQPPEKGQKLDKVNSLLKHSSPWVTKKRSSTIDCKLSMLRKTLKEVSNKKIPSKAEASKQKSLLKQRTGIHNFS